MARLYLIRQGTAEVLELTEETTIGRAASNSVCLEGEEVSRAHAMIYRHSDGFCICDLNSKNGVQINGKPVTKAVMRPGDEVVIGAYRMVYEPTEEQLERIAGLAPAPAKDKTPRPDPRLLSESTPLANPVVTDKDKVFYGVEEVEDLVMQLPPQHAAAFLAVVLRMHELIQSMPAFEFGDRDEWFRKHLLEMAVILLDADRGAIVMRDANGAFEIAAAYPEGGSISLNRVVLRATLRNGQAVLCNDVPHSGHFAKSEAVVNEHIAALAAVPLAGGGTEAGTSKGLVYVDTIDRPGGFREEHLHILQLLAGQLALWTAARAPDPPPPVIQAAHSATPVGEGDQALLRDLRATYLSPAKRRTKLTGAIASLAQRRVVGAVPEVAPHLADKDPMVASAAFAGILDMARQLGDDPAVEQFYDGLLRMLAEGDEPLQLKVAEVLSKCNPGRQPLRARLEALAADSSMSPVARANVMRVLEIARTSSRERFAVDSTLVGRMQPPPEPPKARGRNS